MSFLQNGGHFETFRRGRLTRRMGPSLLRKPFGSRMRMCEKSHYSVAKCPRNVAKNSVWEGKIRVKVCESLFAKIKKLKQIVASFF